MSARFHSFLFHFAGWLECPRVSLWCNNMSSFRKVMFYHHLSVIGSPPFKFWKAMCDIRPSHLPRSVVSWDKNGLFTLRHFKALFVALMIKSFILTKAKKSKLMTAYFGNNSWIGIYLAYNASMTVLLCSLQKHICLWLVCSWVLKSLCHLCLMISRVYLTDKGPKVHAHGHGTQ